MFLDEIADFLRREQELLLSYGYRTVPPARWGKQIITMRKADILIIGATTEKIRGCLLKTTGAQFAYNRSAAAAEKGPLLQEKLKIMEHLLTFRGQKSLQRTYIIDADI